MELIKVENGIALLNQEVQNKIANFEKTIKKLKEQEDKLKEAILNEMENKNIIKIDTDEMIITYVAPTERESLDSKILKQELPEIYNNYVKISPVKSSIRIKVK